jgi:hypothetical protein
MTRAKNRYATVAGIVLSSLSLVWVGALGALVPRPDADVAFVRDIAVRAQLDALEPALVELLAAGRGLLPNQPGARGRFEHALARFDDTVVELGALSGATGGDAAQLVDAARHMLPRVRELGHEILRASAADAGPKLALFGRLGTRTLVALRQLRESAPPPAAASESIVRPGADGEAFSLRETLAVCFLVAAHALGIGLLSTTPGARPARPALPSGSR